jgi:hypothetical protein
LGAVDYLNWLHCKFISGKDFVHIDIFDIRFNDLLNGDCHILLKLAAAVEDSLIECDLLGLLLRLHCVQVALISSNTMLSLSELKFMVKLLHSARRQRKIIYILLIRRKISYNQLPTHPNLKKVGI